MQHSYLLLILRKNRLAYLSVNLQLAFIIAAACATKEQAGLILPVIFRNRLIIALVPPFLIMFVRLIVC